MIINKRKYYMYAFAVTGVLVASLWYQSSAMKSIKTGGVFEEVLPVIAVENLVDIGVVDFDGDGYFDIFTSNHNQRSLLLKNDGAGGFSDVLSEMGLDQSSEFPGIESADRRPNTENPGFYLFWKNKDLILKWKPAPGLKSTAGRIILGSDVQIEGNSGINVRVSRHGSAAKRKKTDQVNTVLICDSKYEEGVRESNKTIIDFSASLDAELHIVPDYIALPVSIEMDDEFPLEKIYVGQYGITPQASKFSFELVDRHGMAWADYNGDGKLDVYIVRGGLKGHIGRLYMSTQDELYKRSTSGFINIIDETNMDKKTCPGYQLQWVDFNNDNALDLYISCQRRNANQLFMNNGAGIFTEVAAKMGVNTGTNHFHTPFLWLDINQDNKVDLLVNYGDDYLVMINTDSGFKAESKRLELPGALKMTVNDYDRDGDSDVFVVSSSGFNTLLKNNGGQLEPIPATDLGLPESALTADWVDFDNDGIVELHLVPGGIYRQNGTNGFSSTDILKHGLPGSMFNAISNWVDLDNDGDRDLVLAVYYKDPMWQELYEYLSFKYTQSWKREYLPYEIRTFINTSEKAGNHWLQIELEGRPSNVQAIGARLTLEMEDRQVEALVGQSEGSHLSQGHYRLYFGLGDDVVKSIKVNWPDGNRQTFNAPLVDHIIKLKQAEY